MTKAQVPISSFAAGSAVWPARPLPEDQRYRNPRHSSVARGAHGTRLWQSFFTTEARCSHSGPSDTCPWATLIPLRHWPVRLLHGEHRLHVHSASWPVISRLSWPTASWRDFVCPCFAPFYDLTSGLSGQRATASPSHSDSRVHFTFLGYCLVPIHR